MPDGEPESLSLGNATKPYQSQAQIIIIIIIILIHIRVSTRRLGPNTKRQSLGTVNLSDYSCEVSTLFTI